MIRPVIAAIFVGFTAFWLFFTPWRLGVGDEWFLSPNARAWPLGGWGLPLAVLLIFGGAAAFSVYDRFKRAKVRKEQTNATVTALVCLFVILLVWPWALLGPGQIGSTDRAGTFKLTLEGRFNVLAALYSDVATEYFGAAWQIEDVRDWTRNYAQKQTVEAKAQAHLATHPPGAVLFYYGARKLYENSPFLETQFTNLATSLTGQSVSQLSQTANLLRETSSRSANAPFNGPLPEKAVGGALFTAFLIGLVLASAIPAVYGVAAFGAPSADEAEKRGILAAAFWALAPMTNLFAFTLDAVLAALIAWSLFFAARSLGAKPIWPILAGLTMGATSFLSIGALAALFLLVLGLAIQVLARDEGENAPFAARLRPLGQTVALLMAGFLGFWVLATLWGGFNPLEIVGNALRAHREATLSVRSYWPWIPMNLVMASLFFGWALLAGIGANRASWKDDLRASSGFCFGVAALLTILFLALSGNVRGEVERLWLFLLAPLAVLASCVPLRVALPLLGLQSAQTLFMAAMLAPLVRPF